MDITFYVMAAGFAGFIIGMLLMYAIVEIAYYTEERRRIRRNRSMLDFAEYVAEERKNKQIDFNLFEDAGGSFDEHRAD